MWLKKDPEKTKASSPALPISEAEIEEQVKAFVGRKSKLIKPADIDRRTSLFASGLLDSLTFVQLVVFLEKTFTVKFPPAMVASLTSLDTIDQVIQCVLKAGIPHH